LAWLGGGAIAAGGGGMASGGALLAMAGPIGWGLAGVAVVGGGYFYASKNKEIAEKADASTLSIRNGIKVLELSERFIELLTTQTSEHAQGLRKLLEHAASGLPSHYSKFSTEQLELVAAVINHVHVLTELMQRTVTEYLKRQDVYDRAKTAARPFFHALVSKSDAQLEREAAELTLAKQALDSYCGTGKA